MTLSVSCTAGGWPGAVPPLGTVLLLGQLPTSPWLAGDSPSSQGLAGCCPTSGSGTAPGQPSVAQGNPHLARGWLRASSEAGKLLGSPRLLREIPAQPSPGLAESFPRSRQSSSAPGSLPAPTSTQGTLKLPGAAARGHSSVGVALYQAAPVRSRFAQYAFIAL